MARTVITPSKFVTLGLADPTDTAMNASGGNSIANNGRMVLRVTNTNSGSTAHTLTLNIPFTIDGQTVSPHTVSIAAGVTKWFGPFRSDVYSATLLADTDSAELELSAFTL